MHQNMRRKISLGRLRVRSIMEMRDDNPRLVHEAPAPLLLPLLSIPFWLNLKRIATFITTKTPFHTPRCTDGHYTLKRSPQMQKYEHLQVVTFVLACES